MNRDYFSIGTEYDAAYGRSTVASMVLPIPENKQEIPCDTCSLALKCETNRTECSAFRNWSGRGEYRKSDVGRFVRKIK